MDWDAFHQKAKSVRPALELPHNRYWIGVLPLDKASEEHLQETDFVWMKGHSKIPVSIILEQFLQKTKTALEVELRFEKYGPSSSTLIRDLDYYNDKIIILQAVEKKERTPPLPVGYQGLSANLNATTCGSPSPAPAIQAGPDRLLSEDLHSVPSQTVTVNEHASPTQIAAGMRLETSPSPRSVQEPRIVPRTSVSSQRPSSQASSSGTHLNHPVAKMEPEKNSELEPDAITRFFRELVDQQQSAQLLEAGVAKAFKILDNLKDTFSLHSVANENADSWVKAIDKLKAQAARKGTVVGVVGNTGAGKSSVINALMDEERIVPTNCMRACTAVVTEISWNDSTDPTAKYRAEIEFITRADWGEELNILLNDFTTDKGTVSGDITDQNSDAGIAWAKFRAVYPQKTKDLLASSTVDSLMDERSVLEVLGTIKTIEQADPEPFYRELQRYVDSKEKTTEKKKGRKSKKEKASLPPIEYWPLIKVVKLYAKSSALSTGAVVVDLPGVHDSNAARAAVAQGYMKQCTGLWIVAPINRAVDDKAAKTLLGDSFKRQLKYDGGFSNVTFICSKTDDISVTEAIDSLDVEDQISGLEDQDTKEKEKLEGLNKQIVDLKDSQNTYNLIINRASDERDDWEELKEKLDRGEQVYVPSQRQTKRKEVGADNQSRKRQQTEHDSEKACVVISDDDGESSSVSENDSDTEDILISRAPLNERDIRAKVEELKLTRRNGVRERGEIEAQIKEHLREIEVCKHNQAEIRAQITAICISGRNEYSKTSIQRDFAAGIKELDQENAAEEDEETFDPEEELRDYEAVARSLPVFCVSSRAYQKLCGRLQKDEAVPGFKTVEETEMPQLQAHCRQLTEASRIQTCRTFLLNFSQQLNTFGLWLSGDSALLQLTEDEKQKQMIYLEECLDELKNGLDKAIESCIDVMEGEMQKHILDKHPELIEEAIKLAPDTVQSWGAHTSQGGIHWSTYKAIVRRNGTYYRDFNAELMEPIKKRLGTNWERAFQKRLPRAMKLYTEVSSKLLHSFHETVDEHLGENGVGGSHLALLKEQTSTYEKLFNGKLGELVASMTELQRNANRDFTPIIAEHMEHAYKLCTEEKGKGSFMRMKANMSDHVDSSRHHMFEKAMRKVRDNLKQICDQLHKDMEAKSEEIFKAMKQNYTSALGGASAAQIAEIEEKERVLKAETKEVLLSVNEQFRALANGRIEDDDEEMENDDEAAAGLVQPKDVVDENHRKSRFEDMDSMIDEDATVDKAVSMTTPNRPASAFPSAFVSAVDMEKADGGGKQHGTTKHYARNLATTVQSDDDEEYLTIF